MCFIRLTGMRPALLLGGVGETVESSYFEDIDHEWRQREPICAATPAD